jgi:hypothetical protein
LFPHLASRIEQPNIVEHDVGGVFESAYDHKSTVVSIDHLTGVATAGVISRMEVIRNNGIYSHVTTFITPLNAPFERLGVKRPNVIPTVLIFGARAASVATKQPHSIVIIDESSSGITTVPIVSAKVRVERTC